MCHDVGLGRRPGMDAAAIPAFRRGGPRFERRTGQRGLRPGGSARWAGLRVPCILGYDVAGVIDSVGPGVTSLAPGDRVMAMTHFPDGAGGYAELVVIDAALVAPIGAATSVADAAAPPP